ncbi:MAG: hypothetical protein FWE98_05620 [Oscillospiraceae bacterium]|nr:hypothetical protein [Oscillospiraceae bacterium]
MPKAQPSRRWLADAALHNPVLVQAAGLTAIIVAATTLQGALLVSILAGLHLVLCEVLASLMKRVPQWLRAAVYTAIGLAIACPAAFLLENLMEYLSASEALSALASALAPLRVFLPLMAVNALTAMRCERYAILHTPGDALRDALANALGYAAAALLVGGVRELLGYGSLGGVQLSQTLRIRGAWMPFGGFLLLGAMAALLKAALRALSVRGIYRGAEKALELAPEDRLERLEKTRQLLIAEVREAMETKNEHEMKNKEPDKESFDEAVAEILEEVDEAKQPEEGIEEEQAAPETPPPRPRIPIEDILLELELEELLDEFRGTEA